MSWPSTTHLNLTALCRDGQLNEALHILLTTYNPPEDHSTYLQLLQTCILKKALSQGRNVHSFIAHRQFAIATPTTFHNKLIHMYVKCGSLVDARKAFDYMKKRDNVSWNTIIAGYGKHGYPHEAVTLFHYMQQTGLQPDRFTFASVLPACAKIGALEQGVEIHQSIKDEGILSDVVVATTLVDIIDKASELFDGMPQRDVVSWNIMIAGYSQNGFVEKALETFERMLSAGFKPDSVTFVSILPVCAKMGALEQGMSIHRSIMEGGFLSDINALEIFNKMRLACVKPNSTTFVSVLPACGQMGALEQGMDIHQSIMEGGFFSDIKVGNALVDIHAGLVNDGCTYFSYMSNPYRITPTTDHYVCMVDLLARAGYLEDTLNFIIKMPVKPVVVVWMCFLGACRSHKNIGLGVFTALLLLDLDPKNATSYVLLSNIYAEMGRWGEVQMIASTDTGYPCKLGEIVLGDEVSEGRMLSSDGVRITDLRSFSDVLQDEERIKKMTGIDLSENFELEGHHLILMERCLRFSLIRSLLITGNAIVVEVETD
ncbi:pentatricopeptide repeat-containing protein At2g33760-like [Cryptomeria japonica]|uniref:pentatricopeptide repeat-containing protein At2g33760-like n=1 Tax=Cryptomeria japonica TaxID=3369 RepID=UPI0027D9F546|nr:pentatricopeptide repeat-containing protein At2g33760-like [Cryptomeria japonica]